MAKGPKGEKRAADLNRRAFDIVRIASGEIEDQAPRRRSGAVDLGRKGGAARAKKMTPQRRSEIAKKAAKARWRGSPVPSEEE
jgi:hypothetical protein